MSLLTTVGEFDAPELDGADVSALLARIQDVLIREGALGARRVGNSVSFHGYWAGWSGLALRSLGHSAIEVMPGSPTRVRYQFSHVPGVVVAALVGAVLVCMASVSLGRFDVGVLLFYAVGLGGVELLMHRIRPEQYRYFVRRVVDLPLT